MALIGFDIADVDSEKKCLSSIADLENEVITVSEVRRRKAQKVRQVEAVCRMLLKKAVLHKWVSCIKTLTTMLATVEDIKADVSDAVRGFSW